MVARPVSEHVQRPARVTGGCGGQPRLTGRGENGNGHQKVRKMVSAEESCRRPLSKGQHFRVLGWVGKQQGDEGSLLRHTLGLQDIAKEQEETGYPGEGGGP